MTLVFLMLSVAVRRGCLKRNSLHLGRNVRGVEAAEGAAGAVPAAVEHSLGWDVLGPAGPVPDPIRVLPQQPLHLPPPLQEILLRLQPRASISSTAGTARAPAQPAPLPWNQPHCPAASSDTFPALLMPLLSGVHIPDQDGSREIHAHSGVRMAKTMSHVPYVPGRKLPWQ